MHVNFGKILQRPYESKYAIYRRFIISNPTLTISALNSLIKTHLDYYLFVENFLLAKRDSSEPWSLYLNLEDQFDESRYNTQCPVCAHHGYHSPLFQLAWITQCPLHHIELVTKCPECKQDWPEPLSIIRRDCTGCGRHIDKSLLPTNSIINTSLYYKPIIKLFDFISYRHQEHINTELTCSYSEYNTTHTIWPNFNHPLFPSYQAQIHPKETRNSLLKYGITTCNIIRKKFKITPYNKSAPQKDKNNNLKKTCFVNERYKVISEIVQHIKSNTSKRHQIQLLNFSNLHSLHIIQMSPLCPYCVAFSIWYYRVTGADQFYGYQSRNPFDKMLDITAYNNPYSPVKLDTLQLRKERFVPSNNFQKMLYKRDLQASFLYIFKNVCKILAQIEKPINYWDVGKLSSNPYELPYNNYFDKSIYFHINENKNIVYTYHPSENILNSHNIPYIKGAASSCIKFKKKIKNWYFKAMLFDISDEEPIKFGLNLFELAVLEYGALNQYNNKELTRLRCHHI